MVAVFLVCWSPYAIIVSISLIGRNKVQDLGRVQGVRIGCEGGLMCPAVQYCTVLFRIYCTVVFNISFFSLL